MAHHNQHHTPAYQDKDVIQDIDIQAFIVALWRNRLWLLFGGFFGAVVGILLLLSMSLPRTAETQVRIEPELSTAGEVTHIDTEVKVITAWPTVEETVDALGVTAYVRPKAMVLTRRLGDLARGILMPKVEGREKAVLHTVRLDSFRVPERFYGQKFELMALPQGTYALKGPDGRLILKGRVGISAVAQSSGAADEVPVQIRVGAISAYAGEVFTIKPVAREDYIRDMMDALEATRVGVRNSNGIISLAMRSEDPEFARRFLDVLTNIYVHKSLTRGARGKIKTLASLKLRNEQLEEKLRAAESTLEEFRTNEKTVDLSQESLEKIRQQAEWQSKLGELKAERADMLVSRTEAHPSVMALQQQIAFYEGQIDKTEKALSRMPEIERQLFQYTREVEVLKKIYEQNALDISSLTNQVAGLTGYAQLLSQAIVKEQPMVAYAVVAAVLGGGLVMFLMVAYIFFRATAIFSVIRTPDMLRMAAKLPVIASVPRSRMLKSIRGDNGRKMQTVLVESRDKAAEVLRELESKISYVTYGAGNNILLFTSDLENQGKSFISSNFSLLSSQSRRTLLIDGDVVNGTLHTQFAAPQRPGFSDLIVGKATLDEVLANPIEDKLWFIASGTKVPSHNLLHDVERLKSLMKDLASRFDLVIVDYPALVTQIDDPDMLGFAGAIFLVVRQGESAARVRRFLAQYPQGLAKVSAVILNDVKE